MGLGDAAVDAAQSGLHIDQAQFLVRNVEQQQREILGNGKVFSVASAFAQSFHRGGPIVALPPDGLVIPEPDPAVVKVVDPSELCGCRLVRAALQELLPIQERFAGGWAKALGQDALHTVKINRSNLHCPENEQHDNQGGFGKVLQVFRFRRSGEIRPDINCSSKNPALT